MPFPKIRSLSVMQFALLAASCTNSAHGPADTARYKALAPFVQAHADPSRLEDEAVLSTVDAWREVVEFREGGPVVLPPYSKAATAPSAGSPASVGSHDTVPPAGGAGPGGGL